MPKQPTFEALSADQLDILRVMKSRYIEHSAYWELKCALDEMMLDGEADGDLDNNRPCVAILGEAGTGKTSSFKHWAKTHFNLTGPVDKSEEVLIVNVPQRCTPRTLAEIILRRTGQPYIPPRASEAKLTDLVNDAILGVGYSAVFLDECHMLLQSPQGRESAHMMKTLLNSRVVPYAFGAVVGSSDELFDNLELDRRMDGAKLLPLIDWNKAEMQKEFRMMLYSLSKLTGFKERPELERIETALPLLRSGRNAWGRAHRIVYRATMRAMRLGLPTLTNAVLRSVVEDKRINVPTWFNPFDIDPDLLSDPNFRLPNDAVSAATEEYLNDSGTTLSAVTG